MSNFDKKDGYYKPSSAITYEGIRYLTDNDGYKDGIDFEYYKANPAYKFFIKDSGTKNFNSVNDVKNFTTYIEENLGQSEDGKGSGGSSGGSGGGGKKNNPNSYTPDIQENTRNPKLIVPDDYEFVSNPRNPSIDDLRYFASEYLVPVYPGGTQLVEVGGGETGRVDKVRYEYRDTLPPKTFEYKGEVFEPRKMFLNQNKGLKKTTGKYREGKVQKRIDEATTMPTFNFALNPVELIKPSYGDVGQTVNKGLMFQSGYKDLKSNQQELFGSKENFKLEKNEFKKS